MQMTFDQAMKPGILQAFALRKKGYVMRSEKRPGYGSSGGGRNNGRRPKRPRASVPYVLLTLLILVLVWPVGIVMLWRKKVRMQAGTKLLISLLTLCMSVFLIVFALTIHVDNPKYTEFQDKANDWLNKAAADVAVAGDAAYKKGVETWDVVTEFADNAAQPVLNTMADGIDRGVELASGIREKLTPPKPTEAPTQTPRVTPEPTEEAPLSIEINVPENTPDPDSARPLGSGVLTAAGEFKPDETPEPTEEPTPTPEPTEAPEDEDIEWTSVEGSAETEETPEPTPTPSPTPTPTPTPTPSPTPVPEIPVKAAGDATVYYNKEGKLYHMQSSCKKMNSAKPHTLAEAIADGKQKCNACGSPDGAILEQKDLVWADENKLFHTTDECEKFQGKWTLISLNDAIEGEYTPCADCQADIFAIVNGPTPEPTPEPTAEPTPTPEAVKVSPAATLKPAGDATVYHSSNGKFYHKVSICKGMTGSSPYKLRDIDSSYKRCKTCDAPDTALVGKTCLWMDEDGLCHTTDECAKFNGAYTLIEREDALEQGLTGCPDCGGDEYLVPNTTLAE